MTPTPSHSARAANRLSADIGGTFTDVVLETGETRRSCKILTTHRAPEEAVLAGVRRLLAEARIAPDDVGLFVHGMTLATNAIIERRGARTALVTTDGFRDVLELGYEGRYDPADLMLLKPEPLIPRELRFGVPERIAATGEVLISLDEAALRDVAARLRDAKIESVAVGFLHSYVNPAHEKRARAILADLLPGVSISLSCEVCPEIREYDRLSTVAANAYIQPIVATYLGHLLDRIRELGVRCPAFLMTSGGGMMPFEAARSIPVRLVESGPAGGAVLSASIGREIGERRILSFDMGGTTAKICFISDGAPQVAAMFEVDRIARFRRGSGLPLRIPVVELVEIGAGGGSIVSADGLGRIAVGPQSAGSEPGPACYGRGGERPTVTDADVALGRIDASRFAGGSIQLDATRAVAAFENHLSGRLGLDAVDAAFGAIEVIDEAMANAARVHAAELGRELADHALIAFGGSAPLHACRLAEKLGIDRVIVPKGAGVGSALGFLRAPMAYDAVASLPMTIANYDRAAVQELLERMRGQARAVVQANDWSDVVVQCSADMRYVGQGHEVSTPIALSDEAPSAQDLLTAFERRYAALFGRTIAGAPTEILSWKLSLSVETWRPAKSNQEPVRFKPAAKPGSREAFDARLGRFIAFSIYERDRLSVGDEAAGPALIVEDETTTVVTEGFVARVDAFGHLALTRRRND